jgi:hypothetical protein
VNRWLAADSSGSTMKVQRSPGEAMSRNDSSGAPGDSWFTVSLTSHRPESLVWTWLALAGLVGAIVLAIVGLPSIDIHGPLHYAGIMDPF